MNTSVTAPPEIIEKSSAFQPPQVWVGSLVYWMRPGRESQDCCAAIVQRVHVDGTLSLSLIHAPVGGVPSVAVDQEKTAVLHRNDPRLQNDFRLRYGCWDLTEHDKQFRQLQADVARLQRKQK